MLTSLPPETLGASLASATAGALLDVAGFLVFVVVAWAIITSRTPHVQHAQPAPRPAPMLSPKRVSLRTAMTPLEVDLATVETLPVLSIASPESSESVDLVEALRSELPDETPHELLNETPMPSSGSSLAVLDGVHDAWPPAPHRPGEKAYRYVLASGQLVRLRDLRVAVAAPPSGDMLN